MVMNVLAGTVTTPLASEATKVVGVVPVSDILSK